MKALIFLFAIFSFVGCEGAYLGFVVEGEELTSFSDYRAEPIVDIVDMTMEKYGLYSEISILDWVSENIKYEKDWENWGVPEYWQTPEQTLTKGTGDCEDYCILAQEMLMRIGVCSTLHTVKIKGGGLHMIIKLDNGAYCDPQFPVIYDDIKSFGYIEV